MLQQTVISAVIPYYERWMKQYPDIHHLARSSEKKVMRLWEGLGYYSRAANILRTARILVREKSGLIPDEYEKLIRLPGIGDYTASAILSIAFKKPCPVMDANVRRVFQRILGIRKPSAGQDRRIKNVLRKIISRKNPGTFNEAVMELGQKICLPGEPLCGQCPALKFCFSFRHNLADRIPEKKKQIIIKKETWLPVLLSGQRLLVMKKEKGVLRHLWLLPQIKKKEEMARFIRKNLTEKFQRIGRLPSFVHRYTRYADTLHPVLFRIEKNVQRTPDRMRWADLRQILRLPFPSVYRKILGEVKKTRMTAAEHEF